MVRYRSLLSLAKVIISECFCGIVATFSGYYVKGLCCWYFNNKAVNKNRSIKR
nr:MAG TPA: hypothetical protein [Caudoviricetes sp.]